MTGCRLRLRGEAWRRSATLCGALAIVWLLFSTSARADDRLHSFDVPPGTADRVVNAIADVSGDFILYPYDALRETAVMGVSGRLTVHQALNRALAGTGLESRVTSTGAIVIAARAPPAEPAAPAGSSSADAAPRERVAMRAAGDTLVVTGTRVRRTGMTTPVPVTILTREEFDYVSPSSLISVLDDLPQFLNNSTPDNALGTSGAAGQSILNLRGIGSNRTLILLDGRRMVSSNRRGTIDIGIFPEALINRVEIVTGGASAAYGSDAVAGVANMLLDTEFEGLRGHVQAGTSERGDYESVEAALSAGLRLGERTHLLLSLDTFSNEGIDEADDRDWHAEGWGLVAGQGPGAPRWIVAPNVVSSEYTFGGLVPRGPLAGTQFLGDGRTAPFNYGVGRNSVTQQGGDGVDVAKRRTLAPSAARRSVFGYLEHDLDAGYTVFAQALVGQTEVGYDKDPSYMAGQWAGEVFLDNAYLPEDIRQRMIQAGVSSFPFSRYGGPEDLSIAKIDAINTTASLTAGLEGDVGLWRLEAYYQYGTNRQDINFFDTVRIDRIYRSLDSVRSPATGEIVCRSTLSFPDDGCVPTSFFGDGSVSAAAKAWLLGNNTQTQDVIQHFAEIAVDGEPLSTWVGPVSTAFGASWRYDEYDFYTHPFARETPMPSDESQGYRGLPAAYDNGPLIERAGTTASHGKTNVGEVFGEAIVPLLADEMFAHALDLQMAFRYASYENSGGIWAGKVGADWSVTPSVRLRTTYSRDVRAGTLAEQFEIAGRGVTARDPFLTDSPSYVMVQIDGGNAEVDPEKADTFTSGVVYRPFWAPGLSASADYYDIRIKDAIAQLGVQRIINNCYDGDESFCGLIRRGQSGFIEAVNNAFLNVDSARTRGMDLELLYEAPIEFLGGGRESIAARAIGSFYFEASTTVSGSTTVDRVGQTGGGGVPDYRILLSTTYENGPLSLNLTGRYIPDGLLNATWEEGVDVNDNTVDDAWYASARFAYEFDLPERNSIQAYLNVENIFDLEPPIAPSQGGGFFGTFRAPSAFDRVGRAYTVGLRWER